MANDSGSMPTPLSSISTSSPRGISEACISTCVAGSEKAVAFSSSSASRCVTVATANPGRLALGAVTTLTRA